MTYLHKIALDRASIRRTDEDGHMHVALTPISKAAVNPYLGREIPGYGALGLDPDRTYNLLRDPAELAKAAPTFAGKPLLLDHQPVSADDHPKGRTVGAVGQGVVWRAPYLMAPLTIWDGEAIRGIESGRKKELSSAYRYTPDMTPGTYEGQPYQGVMRNLIGNHVALCEEGRVGADVVVGDAKPRRRFDFSAFILARDEAPEGELRAEMRKMAAGMGDGAWLELARSLRGRVADEREALAAHVADPRTAEKPEPAEGWDADLAALADSLDDTEWTALGVMLQREAHGIPWDDDPAEIRRLCNLAQDAATAAAKRAVFPSSDRLNPRHTGPRFPDANRLVKANAAQAFCATADGRFDRPRN